MPTRAASQKAFLKAYAKTGVITSAARAAGITRQTVYRWREESETFLTDSDNAMQEALDGVEDAAFELAKQQDGPMQRFILSRRRPQVWGEKIELNGQLDVNLTAADSARNKILGLAKRDDDTHESD